MNGWHRHDWLKGNLAPALVVIGLFLLLAAFGVTNSSIGVWAPTTQPGIEDGVVLGTPRAIRSDEFQRTTPWRLGTLRRPAEEYRSPLTLNSFYSVSATPHNGIAEYVVFIDAAAVEWLGPILPDAFVFSLSWWLPTIIVLLSLPVWLQNLGVNRAISWLSTTLIVLSPAVGWWSLWPLNSLAWILAASLLLMWAISRACAERSVGLQSILAAVASGIFLARTALAYFPWAVPITAAILIPSLAYSITRDQLWRRVAVGGIAIGVGLLAVGSIVIANWESFQSFANTVYPGFRRSTGSALNPGLVFGAQHLGVLRQNPLIATANQSELATAYTILIVPTLVLLAGLPRTAWQHMRTFGTAGSLTAILAMFFIWIMIDVPTTLGESVPFMNRIPPDRLAQVIGIPVVILFAIALDRHDRFPSKRIPRSVIVTLAGIAIFAVSLWSGASLRSSQLPDLGSGYILIVSLTLAVLVSLAIANPREPLRLLALAAGALAVVVLINPVMVGFGELTNGPAAKTITSLSAQEGELTRWASDNLPSEALLMANAIPSLSGQQWTGPSREDWMVLDPEEKHVRAWNRGTSYIAVIPTVGLAEPMVETPQPDIIVIRIDPCDPALDTFQVTHMITSAPSASQCLLLVGEFEFGGDTRYAYKRSDSEG